MDSSLQVFERKPYRRTWWAELKRALWILRKKRPVHRTGDRVNATYDEVFSSLNEVWQRDVRLERYQWLLGNELLTVDGLWHSMVYAQMVDLWIKILNGKKVLEVGSGRGSVLFRLSELNPGVVLTGLERSHQGILRSRERQAELGTSINFAEGDARQLPFADKTFDVAFTVHVLESMPRDYQQAVSEMARVSRYGIFVEEFREAQNIADLMWLRYKDYFRASYHRLDRVIPLYFTKNIPHKPKYSMGLLVVRFK